MGFIKILNEIFGIYEVNEEPDDAEAPAEAKIEKPKAVNKEQIDRINSRLCNTVTCSDVVIFNPTKYEDCKYIADKLKAGKSVIVRYDLDLLDTTRKIFTFMNGCIYALEGNIKRVSNEVFVYAPKEIDIKKIYSETGSLESATLKMPWKDFAKRK